MSEFIRQIIIKGFVVSYVNRELILKITAEFNAIGTNINQIAMVCNSNKNVFEKDVLDLKNDVAEMQAVIMNYLYSGER
jgi:hypothetical protein